MKKNYNQPQTEELQLAGSVIMESLLPGSDAPAEVVGDAPIRRYAPAAGVKVK